MDSDRRSKKSQRSAKPDSTTLHNTECPIEKQRRSEIYREQKKKSQRELLKPDTPPLNYEIWWKRTKEVMKQIEKPVGVHREAVDFDYAEVVRVVRVASESRGDRGGEGSRGGGAA
ncbi:Protein CHLORORESPIRATORY REDUCTION 41, chloroplastic [Linum grandiflorum]